MCLRLQTCLINQHYLTIHKKVAVINNNIIKKTVLRKRQTEPGLVVFYDIWP